MKALRVAILVLGAFFALDGVLGGVTSNFNIGIIAELLAGAVCLALGVLWYRTKIWIKTAAVCSMAVLLCACVAVWGYGLRDTAAYDEEVLIVLGAGIHGETPSMALVNRLDAAAEYLNKNTKAVAIVTGGQGPQEDITEALAMERYLVARGIDRQRIIREERATSTSENYRFSKKIIDEKVPEAKIVTITNDFHIFRAKRLAAYEGVDTAVLHAKTPLRGIAAMYLRELMAIAKTLVLGV